MNAWWESLNQREKQWVLVGMMVLGFFLLWFIVLSPLYNRAELARLSYQDRATLLEWMEPRVKMIQTVKKSPNSKTTPTTENILSTVEKLLRDSPLNEVPHELSQKDKSLVALHFSQIQYQALMQFLSKTQQTTGIKALEARLKRTDKAGMISADLVLSL